MSAYHVAEAKDLIKLDAMENPYNWPENITGQWLEKLRGCQLNRYPDPDAKQLTATLRRINNIADNNAILLGNGSDEIIQLLLMAIPGNSTVLSPDPGFVMYRQIARCLGLNYQGIPLLKNSFDLDMAAMQEAIMRHQPAIIFLAYPNNPTGNLFSKSSILRILQMAPGLVILDEAYAPFANDSFLGAVNEHERLLVMRTVSKLGLAGLRLGYLVGNPALITQLNKIRLPYNINILTQISADFALSNRDLFEQQTQSICAEREWLFEQLNAQPGITAYPSSANFILFHSAQHAADKLYTDLKAQGILIKNTSPQGGLLTGCLRVTIGKPEENRLFITALQNSLTNH